MIRFGGRERPAGGNWLDPAPAAPASGGPGAREIVSVHLVRAPAADIAGEEDGPFRVRRYRAAHRAVIAVGGGHGRPPVYRRSACVSVNVIVKLSDELAAGRRRKDFWCGTGPVSAAGFAHSARFVAYDAPFPRRSRVNSGSLIFAGGFGLANATPDQSGSAASFTT